MKTPNAKRVQMPYAIFKTELWKFYHCFGGGMRKMFTTNKNIMVLMAPNVFTNILLHIFKVQ